MSDTTKTALVRAIEKLKASIYDVPFSPNTNDAHINSLRADVDFVVQAADEAGLPKTAQRSNGSADLDEPIEHTEAYKDRSNDWLGYASGGQLTRTENADESKLAELKRSEKEDKETEQRLGDNARSGRADEVSNGPDARKTK